MGVWVAETVRRLNSASVPIFVEGTQGHLLSIHTSGFYPYCTSRQCGPLGILADIGLSPFAARRYQSICVFRTFPIRVGGNSGDMVNEVSWEHLAEISKGYIKPEITTVTKRQRRIALWDAERNRQTVLETRPTEIALSFLDYLWPELAGVKNQGGLHRESLDWLLKQQTALGTPITWVSTGAGQENTFRVEV